MVRDTVGIGLLALGVIVLLFGAVLAFNIDLGKLIGTSPPLEKALPGQKPTIIYGQATVDYRIIASSQWKAIGAGTAIGGAVAATVIFAPIGAPVVITALSSSAFSAAMGITGVAAGGAVAGGIGSTLFGANHLTVSSIDVNEVQPYLTLSPLVLGSGKIKCTAQLITTDGRPADQTSRTLPAFGGIWQDKTQNYNFQLRGLSSEAYTIQVTCKDTANTNSMSTNAMEYTTFSKT